MLSAVWPDKNRLPIALPMLSGGYRKLNIDPCTDSSSSQHSTCQNGALIHAQGVLTLPLNSETHIFSKELYLEMRQISPLVNCNVDPQPGSPNVSLACSCWTNHSKRSSAHYIWVNSVQNASDTMDSKTEITDVIRSHLEFSQVVEVVLQEGGSEACRLPLPPHHCPFLSA